MLITSFYGLLIVVAVVAVAVAGLLLTQRLIPLPVREQHNATTGIIYAAVYVMFGVRSESALSEYEGERENLCPNSATGKMVRIYFCGGAAYPCGRVRVADLQ